MIWEKIEGWFDFQNLYLDRVQNCDNAVFIEIGCWRGKSVAFLAEMIKESNKNIKLFAIDIWKPFMQGGVMECAPYEEYLKNTELLKEYITTIKLSSVEASKLFEDNSVDFIFIDACHDYKSVKSDIIAWLPKIKKDGIFAGHDYDWPGVNQAVNEILPNHRIINGNTWIYKQE